MRRGKYRSPNNIIHRLTRSYFKDTRVDYSLERAISLVGDKALQHQLTMLGASAGRMMRRGLREAAKLVKRESQRRVPVRTATMLKAIKYRVKANKRQVYAMVYVDPKVEMYYKGKLYRPSKVAHLVEYRHKSFMRSVLADYENKIIQIITECTRQELDNLLMEQMWAI